MKITTLNFLIIIGLLFTGCKDDDDSPSYKDIAILTGIHLLDDSASQLGTWNTPNEKPGTIKIFPNPMSNVVIVDNPEPIERIWIIPATCLVDDTDDDIAAESLNLTYDVESLDEKQIEKYDIPFFNNNIALDLTELPAGFYRIFCQTQSAEIFWINSYRVDANSTLTEAIADLDGLCN